MFSKGKPHIKKEAPTAATSGGEQIKGEQQGEIKSDIISKIPLPLPLLFKLIHKAFTHDVTPAML